MQTINHKTLTIKYIICFSNKINKMLLTVKCKNQSERQVSLLYWIDNCINLTKFFESRSCQGMMYTNSFRLSLTVSLRCGRPMHSSKPRFRASSTQVTWQWACKKWPMIIKLENFGSEWQNWMKVTDGLVFIDSYVVGIMFSLLMILAVSITHIKEILVWKYTKETHWSTFSVSVAWKTSRCLGFKGKFRSGRGV